MEGSPRTPSTTRFGTKRSRSESPSPRTPFPAPSSMEPPSAPVRRRRINILEIPVMQNLNSAFDEAARLAEEEARLRQEADEFHAEQDGNEQKVPNSVMYYESQEPEWSITLFYDNQNTAYYSEEEE